MGPVPEQDPLVLLATATKGSAGVPDVRPTASASLAGVRAALHGVQSDPVTDRQHAVAAVTSVAYRLGSPSVFMVRKVLEKLKQVAEARQEAIQGGALLASRQPSLLRR